MSSKTILSFLKAQARFPKENYRAVSVPTMENSADEWNGVVNVLDGHETRMDNADNLNWQLVKKTGTLLHTGTTEEADDWMFFMANVSAGELLVIRWTCGTAGNSFSFESGDSSYDKVGNLYHEDDTPETSGTWQLRATGPIVSVRVYSAFSGFGVEAYKVASDSVASIVAEQMAPVVETVEGMEDSLSEISDQLYQAELLHEETTSGTEQWILFRTDIAQGDVVTIAWSCPTTGNSFSIESGNSSMEKVADLHNESSTTAKRGTWQFTAQTSIASLRIFSHDTGFCAKVSKGEPQSVLDGFGLVFPTISVNDTGLYKTTDGTLDSTTSWYGSNCKFPVTAGQVVTFQASPLAAGYGVAWMGGGSYVGGKWFDLSASAEKTVVVPLGADEMRISWNRNHVQSQNVKIDNSIDKVRERLTQAEDQLSALDLQRPHAGGRILSLGDSYTMMNHYGRWLAAVTGCEQTPRGYNGENLRHFTGDTYQSSDDWSQNITLPLTSAVLKQYDIITIMGGTNDYGQGYAAGTIADSKDANTVAGHLKWLLDALYSLNPDARIYVCTQPYRVPHPAFHDGAGGHIQNAGGSTLEDCMNAVVAVCRYYGIPCLDFYHESGWNEWTNRVTNPEAGAPSASNIYPPFADNPLTMDGLHPRDGEGNGGQQLGIMFGQFINTH